MSTTTLATILSLCYLGANSQHEQCVTGFVEDITTTDGNLRVLPSADLPDLDFVQWIFPFINFTCYGKITRWTLRVEQLEDLDLDEDELWYIPQLSVWRPSKDQNLAREKIGSYELQSSTNETIFPVNDQGPVFEYKMPFAMTVEPSDIIGIRMPLDAKTRRVRTTKPLFLELSRGNATSKSYSTLHNRTTISVSSETRELHMYLPLISVDIQPHYQTRITSVKNAAATDDTRGAAGESLEFETGIAVGVGVTSTLTLISIVAVIVASITYSRCKNRDETVPQSRNTSPLYDTIEADADATVTVPHNINNTIMTTPAEVHDRWVQSVPTREPRQPQLQVAVHQDPMEPQSLVLEGNDKMELGIKLRENKAYRLAEQHKHAPAQETEEYEYVNLNTICTVDAY